MSKRDQTFRFSRQVLYEAIMTAVCSLTAALTGFIPSWTDLGGFTHFSDFTHFTDFTDFTLKERRHTGGRVFDDGRSLYYTTLHYT